MCNSKGSPQVSHLACLRAQENEGQVFPAAFSGTKASFAYPDAVIFWGNKVFKMYWCARAVDKTIGFMHSQSTDITPHGLFWNNRAWQNK